MSVLIGLEKSSDPGENYNMFLCWIFIDLKYRIWRLHLYSLPSEYWYDLALECCLCCFQEWNYIFPSYKKEIWLWSLIIKSCILSHLPVKYFSINILRIAGCLLSSSSISYNNDLRIWNWHLNCTEIWEVYYVLFQSRLEMRKNTPFS